MLLIEVAQFNPQDIAKAMVDELEHWIRRNHQRYADEVASGKERWEDIWVEEDPDLYVHNELKGALKAPASTMNDSNTLKTLVNAYKRSVRQDVKPLVIAEIKKRIAPFRRKLIGAKRQRER